MRCFIDTAHKVKKSVLSKRIENIGYQPLNPGGFDENEEPTDTSNEDLARSLPATDEERKTGRYEISNLSEIYFE